MRKASNKIPSQYLLSHTFVCIIAIVTYLNVCKPFEKFETKWEVILTILWNQTYRAVKSQTFFFEQVFPDKVLCNLSGRTTLIYYVHIYYSLFLDTELQLLQHGIEKSWKNPNNSLRANSPSQPSERTNSTDTIFSNFQSPEQWDNTFLLFKSSNVEYLVTQS